VAADDRPRAERAQPLQGVERTPYGAHEHERRAAGHQHVPGEEQPVFGHPDDDVVGGVRRADMDQFDPGPVDVQGQPLLERHCGQG
jgi:hypothetical protein